MKVYLIPGPGFDHRIFQNLELHETEFEYLNWIEPLKNESLRSYAERFSNKMGGENSKEIVIIGHSFGGILAQEIAAIRPVDKIILISSIKSQKELPLHFRVVNPLLLQTFFSKEITEKTIQFWGKYYDYETPEEQSLIIDMVNKQSNYYLKWALRHLSLWTEPKILIDTTLSHIHGKLDRTLPCRRIQNPVTIIEDAKHFMVYKKPKLISEIINKELNSTTPYPK